MAETVRFSQCMETSGRRTQVVGLVAAALEPSLFSEVVGRKGMSSLRYLVDKPVPFQDAADLFCLDLYKITDFDQSDRSSRAHHYQGADRSIVATMKLPALTAVLLLVTVLPCLAETGAVVTAPDASPRELYAASILDDAVARANVRLPKDSPRSRRHSRVFAIR